MCSGKTLFRPSRSRFRRFILALYVAGPFRKRRIESNGIRADRSRGNAKAPAVDSVLLVILVMILLPNMLHLNAYPVNKELFARMKLLRSK